MLPTGQVLAWDGAQWAPNSQASGGVISMFGRTGAVTAQTGDYTFTQLSGSVATGQLPTAGGNLSGSRGSTARARTMNNAGMNIKNRATHELTPEAWRAMLAANLDGAFYCTSAVLPQMRDRKDGVIININSIAGKRSGPLGGVSYNAAKFGMAAMGICVGAEEKDNGIRVCNIYPGEIDTPILEHRPTPVSDAHRQQILRAEDVADAVLFVAALPPRASVPELVIKPTTQMYI